MDFRFRSIALLLIVAGSIVGCGSQHITLNAPLRTAPLGERMKAYEDLQLTGIKDVAGHTYVDSSGKMRTSTSKVWTLGNRKEVHNPEDLLQVVDPQSETAKHLNGYAHASDQHSTLGTVSLITLLGGVGLLVTGALIDNTVVSAIGGVGVLASPALYITYYFKVRGTKSRHLLKARDLYNRDLSTHLAIELSEDFTDTDAVDATDATTVEDSPKAITLDEEFTDTNAGAQ